jgi:hypothetical protein
MRKNLAKGIYALIAVALVVLFATPSMAIILNSRTELMKLNAECDRAGTFSLTFQEDDFEIIYQYLSPVNTPKMNLLPRAGLTRGTANYVEIEVKLGGTNLPDINADIVLCKDIKGDTSALGAAGQPLPHDGELVALDVIGEEVSDVMGLLQEAGIKCDTESTFFAELGFGPSDITAYAWGESGATSFFIYLVDMEDQQPSADPAVDPWDDPTKWPFIRLGLYNEVKDFCALDHTAICVNTQPFAKLSTLNVSLDVDPQTLTITTADDRIGTFQEEFGSVRDCNKGESCIQPDTEQIELCPIEFQADCPRYYKCIVADVSNAEVGENKLIIKTSDLVDVGDNLQKGVYLLDIDVVGPDGAEGAVWTYRNAAGQTTTQPSCSFEAIYAEATYSVDIENDPSLIRFCVTYTVDPTEAKAGDTVKIYAAGEKEPCGELFGGFVTAADLVECGQTDSCMYFPYVLYKQPGWATGIVITNLSDAVTEVPVSAMKVSVLFVDSAGNKHVGDLKADYIAAEGKLIVETVDKFIDTNFPDFNAATGPGWLWVKANFTVDGYCFMTDGVFGAGTLPRLLTTCESSGFNSLK